MPRQPTWVPRRRKAPGGPLHKLTGRVSLAGEGSSRILRDHRGLRGENQPTRGGKNDKSVRSMNSVSAWGECMRHRTRNWSMLRTVLGSGIAEMVRKIP
jgi:hypothetical protein